MKGSGILSIFLLYFVLLFPVFGEQRVKINEFTVDSSPQQVELINTSSSSADISNLYLDDGGGTTYYSIPQDTHLYPNSCLVFSSHLNLNKSSPDTIRLFDNSFPPTATNASLIDSYAYKLGPGLDKSYLRNPDGEDNWITGSSALGQYNLNGKNCIITPTTTPSSYPTPTLMPSATPSPTPTIQPATAIPSANPSLISYDHIFISEVMMYPEAGQNEWIELYNGNDFPVSLNSWYIDDSENGGSTPKLFSLQINAKGYAAITLSSSLFNNDRDSVRLLDFNRVQKDGFEYQNPRRGKSLVKVSFTDETFCEMESSYGTANTSCISPTLMTHQFLSPTYSKVTKINEIREIDIRLPPTQIVNKPPVAKQNVLGASTVMKEVKLHASSSRLLVSHLSFLSFSYSILTIVSVLIRMRNG